MPEQAPSNQPPDPQTEDLTVAQWQEQVDQWIRTVGVRYFDELTNTAILMEEVGELARHLARQYGEQSYKTDKQPADPQQVLADELADVLFVLTCLANQTGVNLTQALHRSMAKRTQRDQRRHHQNPKLGGASAAPDPEV